MGTAETGTKEAPLKPYAELNPAVTAACVNFFSQHGVSELLTHGGLADSKQLAGREPRYSTAITEFLVAQGILEGFGSTHYKATDRGQEVFARASKAADGVAIQRLIVSAVEGILDLKSDITGGSEGSQGFQRFFLHEGRVPDDTPDIFIPPAIAVLTEYKQDGHNAGEILRAGESVQLDGDDAKAAVRKFADRLWEAQLLERKGDAYTATKRGKEVLKVGSFATLLTSYYGMFQLLFALSRGDKRYGLGADVYRHGALNAKASNGMTHQRVTPYITAQLSQLPELCGRFERGGAFIDFGSGGGDVLTHIATHTARDTVRQLFGMDFNASAIGVAREAAMQAGLGSRISYMQGSITDGRALANLYTQIVSAGYKDRAVASINALLHDIGRDAAAQFLRLYKTIFGDTPLIVTETPRVPLGDLKAHPDYSAAAFQMMHDASGQELLSETDLKELIREHGFKIIAEKSHASMPGAAPGTRWNTAVSFIAQEA